MTIYDVGDRVNVSTLVTVNNVATDATMAIAVTKPDNTIPAAPTINHPGVGQYNADIDVDQAGNWLARWVATGTAKAADEQQFYVQPQGFRIVSLTDAKAHINKTGTYTGDDNELRGFIDAAGELVDVLAGPTVNRTVVEYHSGPAQEIFLNQWPVVSVTSVIETWPGGPNYTLNQLADLGAGGSTGYDFTFDAEVASITRRVQSWTYAFPPGTNNIKVTYVQGRRQPWPARIRMGALDEISYLWRTSQTGRGAGRPSGIAAEPLVDVAGFGAVPVRVVQLLSTAKGPLVGA